MAGGLNLYGFANGDPVNFSDPFGLCKTYKDGSEDADCRKLVNDLKATGASAETGFLAGEGNVFLDAADAYEQTDKEVEFVDALNDDLNWNGENSDKDPKTNAMGRTMSNRILIGNFLGQGDMVAAAAHEVLAHAGQKSNFSVNDFAPEIRRLNSRIFWQLPTGLRASAPLWQIKIGLR